MTKSQASQTIATRDHKELYDYINNLSESDKLGVIASIIEDNPSDYKEMTPQEKSDFIIDNLIMGINCELYEENTDKGAIDWAFSRIIKYRANKILPGAKWWLYYCCLVHSMSYTCKDLNLLDDIDLYISNPSGYVSSDQLRFIAEKFNVAFRLRAINEKTNKIELGNKENKGWYGNPDKAKYKFEIGRIDNHYIPWIEDTGITEYYINNIKAIDEYAEAHNWSDNKKTHTYKKVKNCYINERHKKLLKWANYKRNQLLNSL